MITDPLSFRYFGVHPREIHGYSTQKRCHSCCRVLPGSPAVPASLDSDKLHHHCLRCISEGKATVWHETELGSLEHGELSLFDFRVERMVKAKVPRNFRRGALEELCRTPHFKSHQGAAFLVHCRDFMRYIGRWSPADFAKASPNSPRDLYLQSADGEPQLWDETLRELEVFRADSRTFCFSGWAYGSWCYVFRCLHCSTLRSTWDTG